MAKKEKDLVFFLLVGARNHAKSQPLCKLRRGDGLSIHFKNQLTLYKESCIRNRHFNQWKVIDQSTKVLSRKENISVFYRQCQ